MRTTAIVIPALAMVALCAVALPASAEPQREHRNREGNGGSSSARSAEHRSSSSRESQAATRNEGSRGNSSGAGAYRSNESQRRGEAVSRDNGSRGYAGRESYGSRGYDNRGAGHGSGYDNRGASASHGYGYGYDNHGRYDNRGHGYDNHGGGYYGHGHSSWYGVYNRGSWGFGFYYRGLSVGFYSFRPYVNVGYGMWSGYPMAFPRSAYLYGSSPVYSTVGGVSFEMTPGEARVYVDGYDAGCVSEYGPYTRPLSLQVGWHHIEVVAPGFRTAVFDVDVQPGQLIPYRGQLEFLGR
jgi:hypothetical protein